MGRTMILNNFFQLFLFILFVSTLKFFVLFVAPYFIFWNWFPKLLWKHKIQQIPRIKPILFFEFSYSMLSVLIQSLFLAFLFWGSRQGYFNMHLGFGSRGYELELLAFISYFIIYDIYFYWSHRLLHFGWFYKNVHSVHHRSTNPTPLAAYSFHPIETLINVFYMLPFVFIFPVSYETFIVLLLLTDLSNLGGHFGFELFPLKAINSKFGNWLTTPTHHNLHHQHSKTNFALYWNGWDEIFKTSHPRTRSEFYRIKNQ